MNLEQGVETGDLDDAHDAGIGDDQRDMALRLLLHGAGQGTYAGRVEDRALREVDHEARSPGGSGDSGFQARCSGEVELSGNLYNDGIAGHRRDLYVKIARRGHYRKV